MFISVIENISLKYSKRIAYIVFQTTLYIINDHNMMKISVLASCSNITPTELRDRFREETLPSVTQLQKQHWNLLPPSMNCIKGHM